VWDVSEGVFSILFALFTNCNVIKVVLTVGAKSPYPLNLSLFGRFMKLIISSRKHATDSNDDMYFSFYFLQEKF